MAEVLSSLIVLPWILGGLHPDREDLTWAILLAFAAGFLSICATVLSVFDMARFEASSGIEPGLVPHREPAPAALPRAFRSTPCSASVL
jgi:hypothetical protein